MIGFCELATAPCSTLRDIQRPMDSRALGMHSPATDVLTDFTRQYPLLLDLGTPIDSARAMLQHTGARLFLVIDSGGDFRGIVSLDDLVSEKALRGPGPTHQRWCDLTVERVMTPRTRLPSVSYPELQAARIGDLLTTMKRLGEPHLLVTDQGAPTLRGIVSAYAIARRLREPLVINERAVSFSDVCRMLVS